MATKTFNIGEYAIGGRIKVTIQGKVIKIEALDWITREVVSTGTTLAGLHNTSEQLTNYLYDLTSSYYAEQIMDWIGDRVDLNKQALGGF